jgi:hypothetical protein
MILRGLAKEETTNILFQSYISLKKTSDDDINDKSICSSFEKKKTILTTKGKKETSIIYIGDMF